MASKRTSSPFPGFEKVYLLADPVHDKPFRGEVGVSSQKSLEFLRAERQPDEPVPVRHAMGEPAPQDVIWTTLAMPLVISSRVIEVLEGMRATGWHTYPVQVSDKVGRQVAGFYGLAVVGRCGTADLKRAQETIKRYPAKTVVTRIGYFFDPASWDGSDVFMPTDDSALIFVTQEVMHALEAAGVRNIRFDSLAQLPIDHLVPTTS